MSFSVEWDQRFKENTHISIWPWSDLVSLVMRNIQRFEEPVSVLELGCGAGANIPLFVNLGVDFYGVEGSSTIVQRLQQSFAENQVHIAVGDFTQEIPFERKFELIYDRGALTCNTTEGIRSAIQLIRSKLSDDGLFMGVDWFSTEHSEYRKEVQRVDDNTVTGYVDGPFADTGNVHYSDEEHLRDLFEGFEFLHLEKKTKDVIGSGRCYVTWDFIVKPV